MIQLNRYADMLAHLADRLLGMLVVHRLPPKILLWPNFVEAMVQPRLCGTIGLDVGCGTGSQLPPHPHWIGLDVYMPALRQAPHSLYRDLICSDLATLDQLIAPRSVDVVVAFDVVEHLPKAASMQLIRRMETVARRRVILLTPNGAIPQDPEVVAENPWMDHQCGWTPAELRALGYSVVGYSGWKPLAGPGNYVRHHLPTLFQVLMTVTQPFVRDNPERAFHLFCWKDLPAEP